MPAASNARATSVAAPSPTMRPMRSSGSAGSPHSASSALVAFARSRRESISVPSRYPASFPAGVAGTAVPDGVYFIPAGAPKANPAIANTWTWFSEGTSSYHALQVDLRRRFSRGLSVRGVYTFAKALDDGDSLNQTTAGNAPGLVSNPLNLASDKGLATFNVEHVGVVNVLYALP